MIVWQAFPPIVGTEAEFECILLKELGTPNVWAPFSWSGTIILQASARLLRSQQQTRGACRSPTHNSSSGRARVLSRETHDGERVLNRSLGSGGFAAVPPLSIGVAPCQLTIPTQCCDLKATRTKHQERKQIRKTSGHAGTHIHYWIATGSGDG